jgi:hypothetical protein
VRNNEKNTVANELNDDIETFTHEQIMSLSPRDILKFKDLTFLAFKLSNYYEKNLVLAEFEDGKKKYVLPLSSEKYEKLKLDTNIAFGITLQKFSGNTIKAKVKRLIDAKYLANKLNHVASIYREVINFSNSTDSYVTKYTVKQYLAKKEFEQRFLEKSIRINPNGNCYSLESLSKKEEAKASEVSGNCKQLAEFAEHNNDHWLAATITCPPIFHIKPVNGKRSWNGILTPEDNNNFLTKIWRNLLRKLHKLDISIYGHWTKEPHKSSAIHMHTLIYCQSIDIKVIKNWLNKFTKAQFDEFDSDFKEGVSVDFDEGHCRKVNEFGRKHDSVISNYINKGVLDCLNTAKVKAQPFTPDRGHLYEIPDTEIPHNKIMAHSHKFSYRRYGFFGVKRILTVWRELKHLNKLEIKPNKPSEEFTALVNMASNNSLSEFLTSPYRKLITLLYATDDKDNIGITANKYGERSRKISGINILGEDYITHDDFYGIDQYIAFISKIIIYLMIVFDGLADNSNVTAIT